jgi:uridine kinase
MEVSGVASALDGLLAGRTPRNGVFFTVAVDGRGGSGKSTMAHQLSAALPRFGLIHGDDYFEPTHDDIVWGAFNDRRFDAEVLAALRSGERSLVSRPYDYRLATVVEGAAMHVDMGVVVDRCFAFELDVPWDVRIWVEAAREVCLRRGIDRDGQAWGERATVAWSRVWQPAEDEYIARLDPRRLADLVVDGH